MPTSTACAPAPAPSPLSKCVMAFAAAERSSAATAHLFSLCFSNFSIT